MDLPGIAELILSRDRGGGLLKFSEPGPRIGESPGRKFDLEIVERGGYGFDLLGVWHDGGPVRFSLRPNGFRPGKGGEQVLWRSADRRVAPQVNLAIALGNNGQGIVVIELY